uniref:Cysteine-rich receptor-like protein kinase 10 n=1 Tax=Araucaria cunninghamii TaxID=56994 RepID=A0A0D6QTZ7_ARACU
MEITFKFNTRDSSAYILLKNVLLLLCVGSFYVAPYLQMCAAADNWHQCNAANYTNANKFESNLNTVLNNLVRHTSSSGGFNTSVSGQLPDQVYGLLQCRGDASVEECYNCSLQAKTAVRQSCGNVVGGKVWVDKCFLRYENYSFIGVLDTSSAGVLYNVGKATDPKAFGKAVRQLFTNLSDAAPSSPKRYSTGTTYDSWMLTNINGLVQCWMDISIDDCKKCLQDAISTLLQVTNGTQVGGVAYLGSCFAHYETYDFFTPAAPPPGSPPPEEPPADSPPPEEPPANSPPSTQSKTKSNKSPSRAAIILGILAGLLLIFGSPVLHGSPYEDRHIEEDSVINQGQGQHRVFNLETVIAATTNFHENNKLGEGGFGPVYKGIMPDGKEVAVKKLSLKSTQGRKEFLNEVKLVAKIQHRNLVNLLGCCAEGLERLLVYEYLPNKSLDKILFDPERRRELDWQKRFNIIIGIARGLLYLHEDSQMRIIHRDIKASNILLDGKMNPKIADFGLERLFSEDETHVSTAVAGTYGYMAPEYAMHGQLSVKADVYSFGVVLLEIVCGRKNTDFKSSADFQSLLDLVWRSYSRGNIVDVIDREITESCLHERAFRCIHVGLLCTQADASLRPLMSSIYSMLSNLSIVNLPDPTRPAFVNITYNPAQSHTSTSTTSTSMSASTSSELL